MLMSTGPDIYINVIFQFCELQFLFLPLCWGGGGALKPGQTKRKVFSWLVGLGFNRWIHLGCVFSLQASGGLCVSAVQQKQRKHEFNHLSRNDPIDLEREGTKMPSPTQTGVTAVPKGMHIKSIFTVWRGKITGHWHIITLLSCCSEQLPHPSGTLAFIWSSTQHDCLVL